VTGRSTLLIALSVLLGACAGVLGIRPRTASRPFEHRAHLLHGVSCVACHSGVANSLPSSTLHLPSDADCRRCHEKPHDDRTCLGCHGEPYVRGALELARGRLRFDHSRHMPAVRGDCVRCHADVTEAVPEAVVPKMATCFGCHRHRDQWALRDCGGCHVDLPAQSTPPDDHLVHDGDWIREHGVRAASARDLCASCHSERQCASCHGEGTVPALPWKLSLGEAPLAGLHRAGFLARHPEEARADPGLCTTCHAEGSCIDCHNRENVAPGATSRSPHPPGWLTTGGGDHGPQARIDPASCASCHGGAGEQLCVGCHRVGGPGGNPHGAGFSSHKDLHHDLPCRECHGVGR
jgi:predicted CXXCH cytochrome family protein